MTVANCHSWCCAEGLKYWSINKRNGTKNDIQTHLTADSRLLSRLFHSPPSSDRGDADRGDRGSRNYEGATAKWPGRPWTRPKWLMNCPDTFCSGRLRFQKHVFDPNLLRPCILKQNASFGSNEVLKNKERPWTMFQWHTCPSNNRVMRQNRTMWQTQ